MALIALEGMRFHAYHGYYKEERKTGGDYVVDVYIETNLPRKAYQDDLYKTVNYETVHLICKSAMKKPSRLIETVAARIVAGLMKQFDKPSSVKVRIKKEHPPLGGEVAQAVIELDNTFVPTCGRCKKPLICFDKEGGCWCVEKDIDGRKLSRYHSQFYNCKCKDCPINSGEYVEKKKDKQ